MARIPLDPPRTLLYRLAEWYSRRTYGAVLDPGAAMAHNPRVLITDARFERSLARWNRLDPTLKALAQMASAATIGCSWCMDFGYWESTRQGVDPAKLRDVPSWRDSAVYTDLERAVMEYAEAMTSTPPTVSDELSARLLQALGAPALVELTAFVGAANMASRTNTALGIESEGFAQACDLKPLATPSRAMVASS
jgi:AhpD family alkylhydroperoxidase